MKNQDIITRDFLNPRHKAVYLQKKGGYYLLPYCLNKGKLLDRTIIFEKPIGCSYNITLLHLYFYINGYYAYIDIALNDKNGFNPNSALYWNDETIMREARLHYYGCGISIKKDEKKR